MSKSFWRKVEDRGFLGLKEFRKLRVERVKI